MKEGSNKVMEKIDKLEDGTRSFSSSNGVTNNQEEQADSPEEIIRRENQAVNVVRKILMVLLFLAAFGVSALVFRYDRSVERDRMRTEYDAIAAFLSDALLDDVVDYFAAGQAAANVITLLLLSYDATPVNLVVPRDEWRKLTQGFQGDIEAAVVAWSPLLTSDEERSQFEANVANLVNQGYYSNSDNSPCFVCTEESWVPVDLNQSVTLPDLTKRSCEDLYQDGLGGKISPSQCVEWVTLVQEQCSCQPITENDMKIRSPSEGLVRLDGVGQDPFRVVVSTEKWNEPPYLPMSTDDLVMANASIPLLYNHMSNPRLAETVRNVIATGIPGITSVFSASTDPANFYGAYVDLDNAPLATLFYPVLTPDNQIAGTVSLSLPWESLVDDTVPENGIYADIIMESTCGDVVSFVVDPKGSNIKFVGFGDLHEPDYNEWEVSTTYEDFARYYGKAGVTGGCDFRFKVYATDKFRDQYFTNLPFINATIVLSVFIFTTLVFIVYDWVIRRRQNKIMDSAIRTNEIVTSLFPKQVRERMYTSAKKDVTRRDETEHVGDNGNQVSVYGSEPIADLYVSATVIFLDIAGFTAWCSEREPGQVFLLLENLYHAFDSIGEDMGVFKIETIGDAYVAVCGIPRQRRDHAVAMTRFAQHCLDRMSKIVKDLEVVLGPGTGDLKARVGLHSGQVTAGVLRGAKARFQLFGDTVNTAARMQTSGLLNKIHISEETAELLRQADKHHWVKQREDKVQLKGKGEMQTYWAEPDSPKSSLIRSQSESDLGKAGEKTESAPESLQSHFRTGVPTALDEAANIERTNRLVSWNVEVLHSFLEKIVEDRLRRGGTKHLDDQPEVIQWLVKKAERKDPGINGSLNHIVIDEMTEVVKNRPKGAYDADRVVEAVKVPDNVKAQLLSFVRHISEMYNDVPFHNFDHASHVTLSASKLINRINRPQGLEYGPDGKASSETLRQIDRATFGISSDGMLQFAAVFSSLVHDIGHTGLTNKELIDAKVPLAGAYRNQSVAEQNSVDLAWRLLMSDESYAALRGCIYTTESELQYFRECLVDALMATDIADKKLQALRKKRWTEAFRETVDSTEEDDLDVDRKATIVFEHIIQASDVAHCMQHWLIYQKYNALLFEERYVAYLRGFANNPPWEGWYQGEIGFFDFYIIPLAEKLDRVGVFGVSYHEYLSYSQQNRKEWAAKGERIVEDLRRKVEAKYEGVNFSQIV